MFQLIDVVFQIAEPFADNLFQAFYVPLLLRFPIKNIPQNCILSQLFLSHLWSIDR